VKDADEAEARLPALVQREAEAQRTHAEAEERRRREAEVQARGLADIIINGEQVVLDRVRAEVAEAEARLASITQAIADARAKSA
jgi:hypothetical protein